MTVTVDEETEVDEEQELRLKFWTVCEASGAKPDVAISACAEVLTNLITVNAPNLEGALRMLEHVVAMMGGISPTSTRGSVIRCCRRKR